MGLGKNHSSTGVVDDNGSLLAGGVHLVTVGHLQGDGFGGCKPVGKVGDEWGEMRAGARVDKVSWVGFVGWIVVGFGIGRGLRLRWVGCCDDIGDGIDCLGSLQGVCVMGVRW